MTRRRPLALLLWAVTSAAAVAALLFVVATRDTPIPPSWGFRGASEAFGITCGTVGAIVAVRRGGNPIGWLFGVIGLCFALQGLANEYVTAGTFDIPGGLPAMPVVGWTLAWVWLPPFGTALIYLPLLFPTGHLVSGRWRSVVAYGSLCIAAAGIALAFAPGPIQQATFFENPFAFRRVDVATYDSLILGPVFLALTVAISLSLGSLVLRFRRAPAEARQQIKWFALAASVTGAVWAVYIAVAVLVPTADAKLIEVLMVLSLMGLPAACGMAILRYRLYDIDRIISRTISYGAVTAVLIAAYTVAVLLLQDPLGSITGGDTVPVAISTLIVAGLFDPLRRRVQAIVDRRFDRARFDAERTTAAFADRLREQVDLPTLTSDLDVTVRNAIAPSSVGLWLRAGGR